MKFTGERYIPTEGGDIRHEHMHRYAWCRQLATDKDVLDIACGEGYGSSMLASVARSVMGVDISVETIEDAKAAYGNQPALEFIVGSAAKIPLPDSSVDLVVSFETIEHHDQHHEMLAEIRRVLRTDGLLVISSPNRVIYSEHAGYHNEFHVKELDFKEFDVVLREQFDNVYYFGQRLAVGSSIFSLQKTELGKELTAFTDTGSEILERASSLVDPVYFIAIAGPKEVKVRALLQPSVFFSEAEDLYTHHREVAKWAKRLDGELLALRTQYAEVVASGEKVSRWAQSLERDLAARTQGLADVRSALTDRNREVTEWAKRLDGELLALRTQYAEAITRSQRVSQWAHSLEHDLAEQTRELAEVRTALVARDQELVDAKSALAAAHTVAER
ncbi:MAG: methyltransferase domain-containing protein, partial [Herbaspirillum sp.]